MKATITITTQSPGSHQEQLQDVALPATIQLAIRRGDNVEIFIVTATETGNTMARVHVGQETPG